MSLRTTITILTALALAACGYAFGDNVRAGVGRPARSASVRGGTAVAAAIARGKQRNFGAVADLHSALGRLVATTFGGDGP